MLVSLLFFAVSACAEPLVDWSQDPLSQIQIARVKLPDRLISRVQLLSESRKLTPEQLACRPDVIAAFGKIWTMSGSGPSTQEAGMHIDLIGNYLQIYVVNVTESRQIHIDISTNTAIAVAHTHFNAASAQPSSWDTTSPVPNFVVSRAALYVTDPQTRKSRLVRTDWRSPCP